MEINNNLTAKIREIFTSVQGEAKYIGYNQLFIRFCGCNLNCRYCDTDFMVSNGLDYTKDELFHRIIPEFKKIHSISLTGGEPLLQVDFLSDFLCDLKKLENLPKIFLETNGTLYENLNKIIDKIDIVAMDVKLDSVSKNGDLFDLHNEFLTVSQANKTVDTFVKVVFNENIKQSEIEKTVELSRNHGVDLFLQPEFIENKISLTTLKMIEIYNEFLALEPETRLIPQVHKFIGVE